LKRASRTGKLYFVQPERRVGELAHHGCDFLNAARGTGEGIEALEAEKGVENIDRLVKCLGGRSSILLDEPPDDDTQALPPPFVSCPHDLLKVRIECSQGSQPARHESIGVPEATEDGYEFIQSVEWFRSTEGVGQVLHSSVGCKGVAQSFEEPDFGAKLVVDGHASDVGFASDGVNAKAGEAISCHEQFAGRSEDAGSRLFGGGLPLTESVWAWAHS
jgi:hypothetical protein